MKIILAFVLGFIFGCAACSAIVLIDPAPVDHYCPPDPKECG